MIRYAEVVKPEDNEKKAGQAKLSFLGNTDGTTTQMVPLATPMAGDKGGLFVMPEVGDTVVVGFVNGDASQPVILGAIWKGDQTPPAEAETERRFVSRTGHALTLSDGDDDGIIIEDTHANKIIMNADGITIETSGDLKIIVGGATTFETKGEATHKASTIKLNPE
ncbi:MAG: phage baseplate assembly protein V [Pseudomonadota bacterium]